MQLKDKIVQRFTQSNNVVGLEVFFKEDGSTVVNVSELYKKGTTVEVKKVAKNISLQFEELKKLISSSTPIILVLNGKGIVNKKVSHNSTDNEKNIFQKAFSNIKEDDFCVQRAYIDGTHSFLSLARKDMVLDLVQKFKANGFSVIRLFLGVFPINFTLPLISQEVTNRKKLRLNNIEITVKDGYIDLLQPAQEVSDINELEIGDTKVEMKNAISYSAALSYFTSNEQVLSIDVREVSLIKEEYEGKQVFQAVGKVMMGLLILALLTNYGFFNYYFNRKNLLTAQISSQLDQINKVDTLKSELQRKRSFLNKSGFLSDTKTSFYADRLAMGVPEGIMLDEMNIDPLLKKQENDTTNIMAFKQGVILLSGMSKSSIYVGDWMKLIKSNNWVKKAELLSYDQDKELNEGRFNIEVNIKH